ncbi:omega-amidase NIT2-like [Haemaphysalis longicornis]
MACSKIRVALIQYIVKAKKSDNLATARIKVEQAAANGAKIVCLPECFGFPFGVQYFSVNAEPVPGDTSAMLAETAKKHGVYLVGGSMAEVEGGKLYNTCLVYGPDGSLIAKHRKVHLFDVDIPGKMTFQESASFAAGNALTTFDTPGLKVGLGICYDLRFAPMAQIYAQRGCKLLVYPSAFSIPTGSMHWELLQRIRAVDNQVYVATTSPATDRRAPVPAWGHTMMVDPMGKVVASAGHEEGTVIADVDLDYLQAVRNQIPVTRQMRSDLYSVVSRKS